MDVDVAVLGGGPGGYTAAIRAHSVAWPRYEQFRHGTVHHQARETRRSQIRRVEFDWRRGDEGEVEARVAADRHRDA